jgi:nitroreductase
MANSFDDVVLSRRSVRKYERREIPPHTLGEVIDLARCAPTSMNGQPCIFIVIRERRTCRELARIKNLYCPPEKRDYPADFLADAPVIVAVCVERRRSYGREIENGVLASGFLLLAAASRGLSGVFLTAYNRNDPGLETSIRELLKVPEGIDPIALLPLGYGATEPPEKSLRGQDEIVRYELFAQ